MFVLVGTVMVQEPMSQAASTRGGTSGAQRRAQPGRETQRARAIVPVGAAPGYLRYSG